MAGMTSTSTSRYPVTHDGPLRVGVVGYGLAGRIFHSAHIAAVPDLTLAYVVSSNTDRAEQARGEHPGVTVVPDVPTLLEHADDLDLVVVASPGPLHAQHARAVLEAGVAALVDKPFVVDPADGQALIDLADERGLPLTVFQNRRYDDDYRLVRDVVHSGVLGDVVRFESAIERWKPTASKQWKAEGTVADGGGLLFDLGAHLIDQAVQLFGEPVEVHAEIGRRTDATPADDDTFCSLLHPDGVRSHLTMSTAVGIPGPRMRIVGTRGALVVPTADLQEPRLLAGDRPGDPGYAQRREGDRPRLVVDGVEHALPAMRPGGYVDFYADLARYLRGDGDNPVDPADSLAVVELVTALHAQHPLD